MKKLLLSTLALAAFTSASAQYYPDGRPIPPSKRASYYGKTRSSYGFDHNNNPDTYYGFHIGLGVGTVNSDADYLDANDPKTGLEVGFTVGKRLVYNTPLYFETGLSYSEKGGKSTYNGNKFTYSLNYLELPLVFKYKAYVDRNISIDPFVGGYVACGVGGKIKDYGNREAYSSFSDDYGDGFKRFDGGIRLGVGATFNLLTVNLSYDIGLANVGRDDFDDTRTGTFNVSLGVQL